MLHRSLLFTFPAFYRSCRQRFAANADAPYFPSPSGKSRVHIIGNNIGYRFAALKHNNDITRFDFLQIAGKMMG
jgi:hypothetical protein